jgi:hypothetical protein
VSARILDTTATRHLVVDDALELELTRHRLPA